MAKLEVVLERRGVASARELSEAVARCQLHGGDLTTSLLQFVSVDEAELGAALSECHGLPAAPAGPLPRADHRWIALLPREAAERYCCYPLDGDDRQLVLAVAHPLGNALKDELAFALGIAIEQRLALEVRIRQAISREYGVPLSARNQRGIARLDGDLDASAQETPLGSWSEALSALPRPPSDRPPSAAISSRASRSSKHPGASPAPGAVAQRPSAPPSDGPRSSRRRGPFSLERAREELLRASTRDDVLDTFFSFANQFFEYSALFGVHSSIAEGRDACGPGASRADMAGIGVPLDLPSSLSEAAESCKLRVIHLGRDGIDQKLAKDLKRRVSSRVLLMPICLRGRSALLLYGDNGEADVNESEVADIVALAPDVSNALARIILKRKQETRSRASVDPAEIRESLAPPRLADSERPAARGRSKPPEPRAGLSEAGELEVSARSSRNVGKSRSNGRSGSKPDASPGPLVVPASEPPAPARTAPAALPVSDTAPTPAAAPVSEAAPTPIAAAVGEAAPLPAAGAVAEPAPSPPESSEDDTHAPIPLEAVARLEDPVFLLARPRGRTPPPPAPPPEPRPISGIPTEPAPAPRVIPKPQVAITLPRTKVSKPRLPSVIVDREATEQGTHHRASAVTRPPVHARPARPKEQTREAAAAETQPASAPTRKKSAASPAHTNASPPQLATAPAPRAPAPAPAATARSAAARSAAAPPAAASVPATAAAPAPAHPAASVSAPVAAPALAPAAAPAPTTDPSRPPRKVHDTLLGLPVPVPVDSLERSSARAAKPLNGASGSAPAVAHPSHLNHSPSKPAQQERVKTAVPQATDAPPPVMPFARSPSVRPPDVAPKPLSKESPQVAESAATKPPRGQTREDEAAKKRHALPPPALSERALASGEAESLPPAPEARSDAPAVTSISVPARSDAELEQLIEALCQGNPEAGQDLARLGTASLPKLMARFPGPVVSERAGPSSRASECGPLLQALAAIGSPATPDIMRSSEDQDARVRRWATLLLGELPSPEACRAVVQRLADDVPRVHQAALDAARLLLESSAANLFRKTLFEVAETEDAPLTLRLRTLEHVAKLRDSASVPRLIAFLGTDTEPIVHKALWALSVVTRQDFGRDAQAWTSWWHAHQAQHRIEWLIDALDHPEHRLRKAAGDELRLEVQEDFGYSENHTPAERQRAMARYRRWWEATGARRFGRLG